MTATKTRTICSSCRAGRCADCTKPLTCECEMTHARATGTRPLWVRVDDDRARFVVPPSKEAKKFTTPTRVVAELLRRGWTREQIGQRTFVSTRNLTKLQALLDEDVPT